MFLRNKRQFSTICNLTDHRNDIKAPFHLKSKHFDVISGKRTMENFCQFVNFLQNMLTLSLCVMIPLDYKLHVGMSTS